MSCQVRRLFLATLVFSILGASLSAQDENIISEQTMDRVIKLRSSEQPLAPQPKKVTKTPARSSRTERLAQKPMELPDPTKIQYDEIQTEPNPHTPKQMKSGTPVRSQPASNTETDLPHQRQPVVDSQLGPQQKIPSYVAPEQTAGHVNANTGNSSIVTRMAPQISTRILAPKFVNLGQPTPIRIQLQNVSQQSAQEVRLIATLPSHAQFVSSQPTPSNVEGQQYEFHVGQIGTRQQLEVQIEIIPNEKRPLELATKIQVMDEQKFAVSVRQPKLNVEISGPQQANTGQWISHVLTVANVGDGIAENVRLVREHPSALHVDENQMEIFVRQIAPGETQQLELKSFAQSAGEFDLGFAVTSNNLEPQKLTRPMTIRQPELRVSAVGPNMNFVNRDGIYAIQIDNSGEVDVSNVKLTLNVAEGLEVTTINRPAKVDPKTGRIVWFFEKIAANSKESIQLKTISKQAGRQVCDIGIESNETQSQTIELVTQVVARADVSINLKNQGGPIEVGGQTEFVVSVSNQGSSPASAVEVKVELSAPLMPVSHESYLVSELDNAIRFSTIEIAPGETKEFRFSAIGGSAGEHVVRGVVKLNGSERALMAEDSVFVFETAQAKVSESLAPTIHRR